MSDDTMCDVFIALIKWLPRSYSAYDNFKMYGRSRQIACGGYTNADWK